MFDFEEMAVAEVQAEQRGPSAAVAALRALAQESSALCSEAEAYAASPPADIESLAVSAQRMVAQLRVQLKEAMQTLQSNPAQKDVASPSGGYPTAEKVVVSEVAVQKASAEKADECKAVEEEVKRREPVGEETAEKIMTETSRIPQGSGAIESQSLGHSSAGDSMAKDLPRLSKQARFHARETRWVADGDEEAEEIVGVLGGAKRSWALWSTLASSSMSMAFGSWQQAGSKVAAMCKDQGGIYIKMGQMFSAFEFAMPKEVIAEFSTMHCDVPPLPWSQMEQVLELGLKRAGGERRDWFQQMNETAVAAASVAQVHKGKLVNGQEVAIKLQRDGIKGSFSHDMSNFGTVLNMMEAIIGFDVKWIVDDAYDAVIEELDFRHEADNMEACAKMLKEQPELRDAAYVPFCEPELSSRRMLVMEWIDAVKLDDKDGLKAAGLDPKVAIDTLEKIYAAQVFLMGVLHGDPHPGNVLVRKSPSSKQTQVVLIDHGGYIKFPDELRKLYAELWGCLKQGPSKRRRVEEILTGWGVGAKTRFIQSQLMMGEDDTTVSLELNSKARMETIYHYRGDKDKAGEPVFADTSKMPKELMFTFRVANFIRSAARQLGVPDTFKMIRTMQEYAVRGTRI